MFSFCFRSEKTISFRRFQALLEFARLPRSGNKKELFARCYILVSEKWSNQLYNKIKQIETMRKTFGRNSIFNKNFSQFNETPIAEPKEPSTNLVRFKTIPFINPIKTIDSSEIFVDRRSFSALCFFISDAEIESIRQGSLKVIIRLVSNNKNLQQSDVLPAYFYAQCNVQRNIFAFCLFIFERKLSFRTEPSLITMLFSHLEHLHILLLFLSISPIEFI